ncbi:diaminopimelate epimerase [Urechidicola croceus]|uniref:Diaminopimelate epimerase n=1 Tax=Urechidicola croceus TaxID=1850246 RepID=A0A1D8P3K2_9FLAO|nr:diaminopimelate epimerase [Urechidicola croceus]AOW19172.1 diaminopimelate epimerase [Urechidicola croceus]
MKIQFYKYQGTGNDFVMIDNRETIFPKNNTNLINEICDRRFGVGADGLILLEDSETTDFKMVYFNADGNESSMCGNGGRCLVSFAKQLNIIDTKTTFDAIDGIHHATIENGIVSLQMIDILNVDNFKSHLFLDTGSPHHVEFVSDVNNFDVTNMGRKIRNGAPYFEIGSNVNFAELVNSDTIKVRTYERGVEDETLSCGTGVTAVAIASHVAKKTTNTTINIETLGGNLSVSFENKNGHFENVFLTGPATYVFEGTLDIK